MRSERDPGGLERWPLGLAYLLRPQVPVSSRKVRESKRRPGSGKSFIASMMAAQDGCHSLGEVLEPHFPLVQAKGRTQGPGSLAAETQNSTPETQNSHSRPGALSYGSAAVGEGGAFPSGWARPHRPSSEVLSTQAQGRLVGLKDGSSVSLWDSWVLLSGTISSAPQERPVS